MRKRKTYCLCNKPPRGRMIACSREGCAIEWFHYKCVGITKAPKGDWFCSECKKTRSSNTEQLILPEASTSLNLTLGNESVQIVCNTPWNGEYLARLKKSLFLPIPISLNACFFVSNFQASI